MDIGVDAFLDRFGLLSVQWTMTGEYSRLHVER